MVLSLGDLSLLSIANNIKNGTIQHPHFLPPKLRQQVLDTVLKRDLINDPKCLALFSSVDFLNGMESFGTEPGKYELEFLNRLKESMATVLPNGETVGTGIRKLNLSVYGCKAVLDYGGGPSVTASCFPLVSQLINQCPNTTSLALRGIEAKTVLEDPYRNYRGQVYYYCWLPSALNENDACTMVMENLVELSLRDWNKLLSSDRPIINFNRLTTLKLVNCSILFDIWPKFLCNVPTLENLQMIGVKGVVKGDYDNQQPAVNGLDWILPFSMPQLKSLEVVNMENYQFIYQCNKAFVDNLIDCPEFRRMHLWLDQKSTDEESMERLANMNIDLTVTVRFTVYYGIEEIRPALDLSSKFKLVRIFHERMDSFELNMWREWSPELSTALEDVIDSCSNLTTFGLRIPDKNYLSLVPAEPIVHVEEMNRINAAMLQLVGNRERAMQLKDLRLWGNFNEAVISALFESCLNLNRLEISICEAVRDQHLINWVSNGGGKLKHLEVCCQYVTSEGIIPILAKSAEGLLSIDVLVDHWDWETVYKNLCPRAKRW